MRKIAVLMWMIACVTRAGAGTIEDFVGRWALYLPGGAGWLEISYEKDHQGREYPVADLLWYGGSVVRRTEKPDVHGDTLTVWRTNQVDREKDADGKTTRRQQIMTRIECTLVNHDEIKGREINPQRNGLGVSVREFTGKRTPPLPPAPNLKNQRYGAPIKLFNGKDLTGWRLTNPNAKNGFRAEEGVLLNDPVQHEGTHRVRYGNIRTDREFEDFRLTLEVNVPQRSNSGIYLRGIYEVQVSDSYKASRERGVDSHYMGAIYSRITPSVPAEKPAGQWQTMDITLCDRHVTVILNGITIIDNQPVYGCTGGALTADEFKPGPIYLQGDHGKVMYRNMVLYPILK